MATLAERLIAGFVEERGYVVGAVPEAQALVGACDVVLTHSDGMTFSMVCVVDAEARPAKRFTLEREAAKRILAECCARYSGTMGGAKQPTTLVVVEVRQSALPEVLTRLRAYSNRTFDRNAIHGFVVDGATRQVVTATRFSWLAGWGWRRFLVRKVREV